MSHHSSGPDRMSPGGDLRLDMADLYAFKAPDDPAATVLIMTVNPAARADAFHPDAVYRFNVDTTGDAVADVAFSVVFSAAGEGGQVATVCHGIGRDARRHVACGRTVIEEAPVSLGGEAAIVSDGPYRVFAGRRSDPFFADIEGIAHDFRWTGRDSLAGTDVFAIVLSAPDEGLGPRPEIGVWGRVSLWRDGELVSMDRGGHPAITSWFNPDEAKDSYNAGEPAEDRNRYLDAWAAVLEKGGHSRAEAERALEGILPDVLRYDRSLPVAYPNGRALADEVVDARLTMMTGGRVTTDGIGPHDDYLARFPYLGTPHRVPGRISAGAPDKA